MRSSLPALLAASGFALIVAQSASAETFTIDLPIVSALEDPIPVLLPQFNGDISDLAGVVLTLESDFTGIYQVEELGTIPGSIEMQRDWEHLIFASDGGAPGDLLIQHFDEWTGERSFAAFDGEFDFDGESGFTENFGSFVASDFEIDPADFAPFVGAGDVELLFDFNSFFSFTITNGQTTVVGALTDYTGTLSVTYDVIPAPATSALLGLAGLCVTRRRRLS